MSKIKITERGWPGHFICATDCHFRRNTLVSQGGTHIVISTVGMMYKQYPGEDRKVLEVGCDRYYETHIYYAKPGPYKDIDVERPIHIDFWWSISKPYRDNAADRMHDLNVYEILRRLENSLPENSLPLEDVKNGLPKSC